MENQDIIYVELASLYPWGIPMDAYEEYEAKANLFYARECRAGRIPIEWLRNNAPNAVRVMDMVRNIFTKNIYQ